MSSIFTVLVVFLLGAIFSFSCLLALCFHFSNPVEDFVGLGWAIVFESLLFQFDGTEFFMLFLQGFFHLVQNQLNDSWLWHVMLGFPLDVKFQWFILIGKSLFIYPIIGNQSFNLNKKKCEPKTLAKSKTSWWNIMLLSIFEWLTFA